MELAVFEYFTKTALLLPQEQRSELANRLLESISREETEELSPQWQAEIKRRLADIDEGRVELISHQKVMQRFEKNLQNEKRQ